jgi:hypothetical protein
LLDRDSTQTPVLVGFLVLGNDVLKPIRVIPTEVTPHCMVGVKALVVFAVSCGAPETVPDVAVRVAYAQGVRSLDLRRFVVAAQMLDDFAQVRRGEGLASFELAFAGEGGSGHVGLVLEVLFDCGISYLFFYFREGVGVGGG